MHRLAWLLCLAMAAAHAADVYRSTGEYGEPVFSDEPTPGSEKVDVPPLTIIPSVTPSQSRSPGQSQDESEGQSAGSYQSFAVVTPEDDQPIRDNAGNVHVGLRVSPPLKDGHRIRIYLDGVPWGDTLRSTSVTLNNVDRGTHNLQAAIVAPDGAELARTDTVTFHLRRVSNLLQRSPQVPGGANRQPAQVPGGAGQPLGPPSVPGGAGGQAN